MNDPQKNDFVYFRNEILKDMKEIETKINEKVLGLYSFIKKFSAENDEKFDLINVKLKTLQDNDPLILENKMNSKIERNKIKTEEKFSDIGTKISMLQKDLSNACFKYDKIVLDNLKLTGVIGEGCPYSNLKYYLEFLHKKLGEYTLFKEKNIKEMELIQNKMNDIIPHAKSELENQKYIISDLTSARLKEVENNCINRKKDYEDRFNAMRVENYTLSNNLKKQTEELAIQFDKLEHIKKEINVKLEEEKINIKKNLEYFSNSFISQKKEFNAMKKKFTELVDSFKNIPLSPTNYNVDNNIDYNLRNSQKLNLNKKYLFDNENLEMINGNENFDDEENSIVNDHRHKLKKVDSNYLGLTNLKENLLGNLSDEKKKKTHLDNEEKENIIDLENNNQNKNSRKNIINQNNLNNIENKNIYTKITIKSVNKKSKDDDNKNINENKEKENNEVLLDTLGKKEEKRKFSKILNKNMMLNVKGRKSLKKIIFNNSIDKKNRKDNMDISLLKNNMNKKLLQNENEKMHEYLSLSNDMKLLNNNYTNTTPYNLKLKDVINKKKSIYQEELLPLNLDHSFLRINSEKDGENEKIIFNKIIQYINNTNHNINKKFQYISNKIGNDIISIKKEINQIYNDVNLLSLNENKEVKKMAPFHLKINNFDLYNNSGIELNMENFKNISKNTFFKNRTDKNFSSENQNTPRNILNSIEPYLIKKFKDKI